MAQSAEKQRGTKRAAAAAAKAVENGRSEDADGTHVDMTDLNYVRGLIEAVDQSGIDRLEIARAGTRIRIAKTPAAAPGPTFLPLPPAHASGATLPTAPASPALPAHSTEPVPEHAAPAAIANLIEVKSPMVGTFYRAPAPDAPPYVEVGNTVSKGQTLCILEAMKLMNELESEFDGIVRDILVEEADPVEYGQVLFRIEPAGSK